MSRVIRLTVLLPLLALSGCGLIYTHTVTPLDVNLNNTPVFDGKGAKGDTKQIRYYVSLEWDSRGIGDIAKKAGMTHVYYADLETLSVLGVWTQQFVHVYGR